MAGFAFVYLKTDLLKSKKELFMKYMAQNFDTELVTTQNIEDIFQSKPYTNKGKITIDFQTDGVDLGLTDFSIAFQGKTDNAKQLVNEDVSLQYKEEPIFTVKYRQTGDMYALTSEEIVNKYIAVDNNNLKALAQKFGITDVTTIPDKIETKNTQEIWERLLKEKERIRKTYLGIINEKISDDKYTVQKGEETVYSLTLTEKEFVDLVIELAETLKNDEATLNILKDFTADTDTSNLKEAITTFIEEGQKGIPSEEDTIVISNYVKDGKLQKTTIESSTIKMQIQPKEGQEKKEVTISYTETSYTNTSNVNTAEQTSYPNESTIQLVFTQYKKEEKWTVQLKDGLGTINYVMTVANTRENDTTVTSRINLKMLQEEMQMEFAYEDTKQIAINGLEIEELEQENSIILNTYPQEQMNNLFMALGTRIGQVFQEKVQEYSSKIAGNSNSGSIASPNEIQNNGVPNIGI